eukprot:TRINITY_DN26149_c0_g1_i2.p1 TRINITY_DN26149_c0_g1~~TRINITY_DN26149_c0_g1_i2.p1  ORF type:complete len:360 (+),score=40.64 TRINITY_DN26149_c0_g1_i2:71-1150(+)
MEERNSVIRRINSLLDQASHDDLLATEQFLENRIVKPVADNPEPKIGAEAEAAKDAPAGYATPEGASEGSTLLDALARSFIQLSSGEWGGWQCQFSSTAHLIPLPDAEVPPQMLYWGQAPVGYETLISEQATTDSRGHRRRHLKFFPDMGSASEETRAQVTCLERPLATVQGCLEASAFVLDAYDAASETYSLETIFVNPNTPEPTDNPTCKFKYATIARRTRVEFAIKVPFTSSISGPFRVSVERKWHSVGYSLPCSPLINTAGGSTRGIPSGLDLDDINSAVAASCFASPEIIGKDQSSEGQDDLLMLAVGISVRAGDTWLEVSRKARDGSEVIVRREFEVQEGHAVPIVKVHTWKK